MGTPVFDAPLANAWESSPKGGADEVERYLASGGDTEARFNLPGVPGSGATPLHLAAAYGHDDVMKPLLENGANVNSIAEDENRGTPLHWAVGAGKLECVKILVEAGADIDAENQHGQTPLDLVSGEESAGAPSADIAAYLQSQGATKRIVKSKEPSTGKPSIAVNQILGLAVLLLCFAPFFAHLWFLWHLCWLLVGFVIVVWLARLFRWQGLPSRAVSAPYCLFWLLPLTLLGQLCMVQSFGPDTSAGLIPWPPVLAYYAIFFGFGAVLYGDPEAQQKAGRH